MSEEFRITMLGEFSIELNGQRIGDSNNRMRKVWLLLAYMICTRTSRATQSRYLSLIQGSDNTEIEDPASRLKALFFRIRSVLDKLGTGTGHQAILHKDGTYCWNPEMPLTLDTEEFERLCTEAANEAPEQALEKYLQAMELYQGDFLPKLSMDPWVMPIHSYYHRLFLDNVQKTLLLLEQFSRWEEATALCERALKIEPYCEELYRHQMRCRLACDDRSGVIAIYERMSELLFDTFGVMPSEESRQVYREALREVGSQSMHIDTVRDHLQEEESVTGAISCEYDYFRFLYQVQARSIGRSGQVIHIALLSLHPCEGESLARKSLDRAMENLQALTLGNLRQGDVVSRCTVCQLIIMLPGANYENSGLVCQRIIKTFKKQYPHSPAQIHYSVQPLLPKEKN